MHSMYNVQEVSPWYLMMASRHSGYVITLYSPSEHYRVEVCVMRVRVLSWMMCVWCVCVQAARQAHGGGRNETHCDGNLTSSFFACWRWCSARRGTRRLLHVQTGGYTKTISTQQQYLARVRCLLLAWFRNRPRLYVYTVHQGWQLREDFIGDLWVENC